MAANDRPRVSFDEIETAMSLARERAASGYLRRTTGEVVLLFTVDGDDEERERVEEDWESYVPIPPESSHRAYEHLVAFAESIDEEDIRAQLDVALSGGKGVFRRFRDVVFRYADLGERFHAEMQRRKVEDVRRWLASEELDVELVVRGPVAPPEPPKERAREPDFVDLLMLGGKTELIGGTVRRCLVLATPRDARAAFERVGRQIVEHCGHAWRKRYVENTSELVMERFRLVHDGSRIELFVETSPAIYRCFAE